MKRGRNSCSFPWASGCTARRETWNTRLGPSSCCPSSCFPRSSAGSRTVSARRASSSPWRCSRSACWRACTGACVPITWTGPSCGSASLPCRPLSSARPRRASSRTSWAPPAWGSPAALWKWLPSSACSSARSAFSSGSATCWSLPRIPSGTTGWGKASSSGLTPG